MLKTFLLPFYGFSFGYKRKGVNVTLLTGTVNNIVGHLICANSLWRQSRGRLGIYKIARQNTFVLYDYIKKALSNQDKADFSEKNIKTGKTLTSR